MTNKISQYKWLAPIARGMEAIAGATQAWGFIPKAVGWLKAMTSKLPASMRWALYGKSAQSSEVAQAEAQEYIKYWEDIQDRAKNFFGELWIRSDTRATAAGKAIPEIGLSILPTMWAGAAPSLFKAWVVPALRYLAIQGWVGLTEEMVYNLGTEGTPYSEERKLDFIIGPIAEMVIPLGIEEIAQRMATNSLRKYMWEAWIETTNLTNKQISLSE